MNPSASQIQGKMALSWQNYFVYIVVGVDFGFCGTNGFLCVGFLGRSVRDNNNRQNAS